jgi:AcrR family transcriptional regulator
MTRAYRLGKRAEQMAATRGEIVHAARALLVADGFHRFRLEDVAANAGVTRATVYNQIGSKLALLEAVLDEVAERAGAEELARAESLDALVDATCAFWARDAPLFRRVIGLAAIDPEAAHAVAARERRRRAAVERVVAIMRPVRSRSTVAAAATAAPATAEIFALTSFPFWDTLRPLRDAPARIRRLVRAACAKGRAG